VKKLVHALWRDERGSEMVEWAVVTAVLLVATTVIILRFQAEILDFFEDLFDTLEDPPPSDFLGNAAAPAPTPVPTP